MRSIWHLGKLMITLALQLRQSRAKLQGSDKAWSDRSDSAAAFASGAKHTHAASHLCCYHTLMILRVFISIDPGCARALDLDPRACFGRRDVQVRRMTMSVMIAIDIVGIVSIWLAR
jgi:hypothetical protein